MLSAWLVRLSWEDCQKARQEISCRHLHEVELPTIDSIIVKNYVRLLNYTWPRSTLWPYRSVPDQAAPHRTAPLRSVQLSSAPRRIAPGGRTRERESRTRREQKRGTGGEGARPRYWCIKRAYLRSLFSRMWTPGMRTAHRRKATESERARERRESRRRREFAETASRAATPFIYFTPTNG